MWKHKLEDTSELSFTALQNKNAAWEKLHARFEEKPKNKNFAWYWIAAECILITALITFFTVHKTNDVAQHYSTLNNYKKSIAAKGNPVNTFLSKSAKINQPEKQLQQLNIAKVHNKKALLVDSLNNTVVTNNTQQLTEQNIILPAIADTTSMAVASTPINQKKLKVVHVNEAGEPIEFPADVAHTSDLHLFQLKLAQQKIYNASLTASTNNSSLSFKPKKSSN